jgi:hypothetical protein
MKMLTKKISFVVPQPANVTMKLYDSIGNFITTVFKEKKPVGIYKVEFSADEKTLANEAIYQLRSGNYKYELIIGNSVETKRMDLRK